MFCCSFYSVMFPFKCKKQDIHSGIPICQPLESGWFFLWFSFSLVKMHAALQGACPAFLCAHHIQNMYKYFFFFPTLTSGETVKLHKCLDWLLSSLTGLISLGSITSERTMPLNTNFINPLNKISNQFCRLQSPIQSW